VRASASAAAALRLLGKAGRRRRASCVTLGRGPGVTFFLAVSGFTVTFSSGFTARVLQAKMNS
jgi:hypothetical protein